MIGYVLLQIVGVISCFLIFPFGLIIGLVLIIIGGMGYRKESTRIKCPSCKEIIMKDAEKCRFCGKILS